MKEVKPLPESAMNVMNEIFKEYMVVGGMPLIVKTFTTPLGISYNSLTFSDSNPVPLHFLQGFFIILPVSPVALHLGGE